MIADNRSTTYYDINGNEMVLPDNQAHEYKVFAKSNGSRYWISHIWGKPTDTKKQSIAEIKSANPQLLQVTETMFNKYIKFLGSSSNRMSISSVKE